MSNQDTAESPLLPLDILYLICEECPRGTLAALCRVYSALLPFAQRRLFHSVDLVDASVIFTRFWCAAVLRHPELANSVRSLSLQPEDGATMAYQDAAEMSAAVTRCNNLKTLRIFGQADSYYASTNWMLTPLSPCTFQLAEFTNSYFSFASLESFLSTQNELRFLAAPKPLESELTLQLPSLPALVGIKMDGWNIPRDRSYQRIETSFDARTIQVLHSFSQTTTLNLKHPLLGPRLFRRAAGNIFCPNSPQSGAPRDRRSGRTGGPHGGGSPCSLLAHTGLPTSPNLHRHHSRRNPFLRRDFC